MIFIFRHIHAACHFDADDASFFFFFSSPPIFIDIIIADYDCRLYTRHAARAAATLYFTPPVFLHFDYWRRQMPADTPRHAITAGFRHFFAAIAATFRRHYAAFLH
jgi:hypothetical protein